MRNPFKRQKLTEKVGILRVENNFKVNSERVRQIECKALRKLRHRSRARHLKYFLSEEE